MLQRHAEAVLEINCKSGDPVEGQTRCDGALGGCHGDATAVLKSFKSSVNAGHLFSSMPFQKSKQLQGIGCGHFSDKRARVPQLS